TPLLQLKLAGIALDLNTNEMLSIGQANAIANGMSFEESCDLHQGESILWRLGFKFPSGAINKSCLDAIVEDPILVGGLYVIEQLIQYSDMMKKYGSSKYVVFNQWQSSDLDFSGIDVENISGEALVKYIAACLFFESSVSAKRLITKPLHLV
ncbi:hypothetical protein COV82_06820, partial [Candidatus Peregrinibacteria bacterium CG11_big_fil_rev_8_21_14_0_20_46_8]